ncbi:MAG: hypothetical protein WCW27_00705 [Patescibacteria group bacterium]|jgi:hypothetical protein
MILDQPLDPVALKKLSQAEKIKLLKQAYAELQQVINRSQVQRTQALNDAFKVVDQQRIEAVRKIIQSLE